jgi:Mg2+/Co2+ transporter CorB
MLGIDLNSANNDELKPEELRTILQSSRVPKRQEEMLMGIFDMDNLSVNDVMIPKNEIIGVDLKNDLDIVIEQLHQIDFTYIPCFEDSIDNVLGFLTLNKKADFLGKEIKSIDSLKGELREPLFVPENTPLYKQLANFQSTGRRVGVIVDEYGDIEGIITLRAILEVIVGEISSETMDKMDILPQADGTYLIEGSMMIRDINRRLDWELPTEGPKTLSGLILEEIQTIPDTNVGLAIANYRIETVSIKDNVIKLAKLQKIDIEEETDEEQE